jgi:hypothetical protein
VQTPLTQFELDVVQSLQAAPPMPQLLSPDVWQCPVASQQPLVHEVASQTQLPATQRWPLAHAACVPHWQLPPTQESASVVLQLPVQAPPAGPQLPVPMVTQLPPVEQLLLSQTQLVPLHTWLAPHCAPLQAHMPDEQVSCDAVQSRQLAPSAPHCVSLGVATQVVALA